MIFSRLRTHIDKDKGEGDGWKKKEEMSGNGKTKRHRKRERSGETIDIVAKLKSPPEFSYFAVERSHGDGPRHCAFHFGPISLASPGLAVSRES